MARATIPDDREWPADFSIHAARRVRQRGLRDSDVHLVLECGTPVGGSGIVLRDRDVLREISRRKHEIQALERLRGCKVVLSEGTIVTCCHTGRGSAAQAGLRKRDRRPAGRPRRTN